MATAVQYGMAGLTALIAGYLGYSVAGCKKTRVPRIGAAPPPRPPCVSSMLNAPGNYTPPEILNQVLTLDKGESATFTSSKADGTVRVGTITKGPLDEWYHRSSASPTPAYFKTWVQYSTFLNDLILDSQIFRIIIKGRPWRYVGIRRKRIDQASEFDGQMFAPMGDYHPPG